MSGYSRWITGRMIPSRQAHDLLLGHRACLVDLGAVPRARVYDNEGAIGRWRGGRPVFTTAFTAFRGALGMGAVLLKPRDPESKGLVERANGYLETSFLAGARSTRRPTSTPGCRTGCHAPTAAATGPSAAARRTASPRTAPPCWPCRRCCPIPPSARAPGSVVTTGCACSARTTRSTPVPSVAASRSGPISTRSPSPVPGRWWPAMPAAGWPTAPSPTRPTRRPVDRCARRSTPTDPGP